MAAKGSLNFVELHVEKLILGLAVAFTLAVLVLFLMGRNRVEYAGQKLGPGDLEEAIAARAQSLQQAVRNPSVKKEPVPEYARQLEGAFKAGILGPSDGNAPPLPPVLPPTVAFGTRLPELEVEQGPENLVVVTPLKPTTPPAMRTGMSMVQRRPWALAEPTPGGSSTSDNEAPVECSWVSGAVYFPRAAQTREMTSVGYEGYRAKVYVVGVDVQRQEMAADGEFSGWKDVEPSLAMPKIEIPNPEFDERTGDVKNQVELERTLEVVKNAQATIMEPEFYPRKAGDEWKPPPLPGYPDAEEEATEEVTRKPTPPPGPVKPPPGPVKPPPGPGAGPGSGPGSGPGPGAGPGAAPGSPPVGGSKADAQKEILKNLKDAQSALKAKDWSAAERAAQAVISNTHVTPGQKRQAEDIVTKVAAGRTKGSEKPPAPHAAQKGTGGLLTDPESAEGDPAIWFHDDSVEPGRTYRYRMRVKLWNRYVGKRSALRDPAQAEQTVLPGEWSLPGEPVTVASKTRFFVKGPRLGDKPAASVEVFTWHDGKWYQEDFDVNVGDSIGEPKEVKTGKSDEGGKPVRAMVDFSTGAVVLDLRFDEPAWTRRPGERTGFSYSEQKSLLLTYLDPADGQVKERSDRLDRSDPHLKQLKDRVKEGAAE